MERLPEDEERSTISAEVSKLIGEYVTRKSVMSVVEIKERSPEERAQEYQAYLRGELPDPRD